MGANLMAHLRSNVTIRIPRSSISGLAGSVQELQASALFVKGRHAHSDNKFGHFHLQITAAGLNIPSADSEAELFKKIPDVDTFERFKHITDEQVVITVRGIGELRPSNANTRVMLAGELDEFGMPRAFVSIQPSIDDNDLWSAMDTASDDAAMVFANNQAYEVLVGNSFVPVAAGQRPVTVLPFLNSSRRDGLGTTHHEAGTLACGDDPGQSVTNADLRFHDSTQFVRCRTRSLSDGGFSQSHADGHGARPKTGRQDFGVRATSAGSRFHDAVRWHLNGGLADVDNYQSAWTRQSRTFHARGRCLGSDDRH
jgi:choline dehydrogenase-like flavoprotein